MTRQATSARPYCGTTPRPPPGSTPSAKARKSRTDGSRHTNNAGGKPSSAFRPCLIVALPSDARTTPRSPRHTRSAEHRCRPRRRQRLCAVVACIGSVVTVVCMLLPSLARFVRCCRTAGTRLRISALPDEGTLRSAPGRTHPSRSAQRRQRVHGPRAAAPAACPAPFQRLPRRSGTRRRTRRHRPLEDERHRAVRAAARRDVNQTCEHWNSPQESATSPDETVRTTTGCRPRWTESRPARRQRERGARPLPDCGSGNERTPEPRASCSPDTADTDTAATGRTKEPPATNGQSNTEAEPPYAPRSRDQRGTPSGTYDEPAELSSDTRHGHEVPFMGDQVRADTQGAVKLDRRTIVVPMPRTRDPRSRRRQSRVSSPGSAPGPMPPRAGTKKRPKP